MSVISVTPTLSSSEGYLVDIRDQVIALIRFLVMNPGGTSDIWEQDMLSFRVLASTYEHSRDSLTAALETALSDILSRKFRDYTFSVNCSSSDYGDEPNSTRYAVSFDILVNDAEGNQSVAVIDGSITADKSTNELTLHFSNSADNQMLA